MRTYLECIPCFFRQALESARLAGAREKEQKKVIDAVAKAITNLPLRASPPEIAQRIYSIVRRITRVDDPYKALKAKSNRSALKMYPHLCRKVAQKRNRLRVAVELAIAGNVIDYGAKNTLNVEQELERLIREEERTLRQENGRLFHFNDFKKSLSKARTLLYLGDNAGETVFDRILLEEIKRRYKNMKIWYVVKGSPVINDALACDARYAGIDHVAEIISSGIDAPGTVLPLCTPTFRKLFQKVDMVISKGQGNFEALSAIQRPVFFLFMAKCSVVAKHVGCRIGDIILLYHSGKK